MFNMFRRKKSGKTHDELEAMTCEEIRQLAKYNGFTVRKGKKVDMIVEYISKQ